ncbi:MAG: hypothetical protein GY701_32125 [Sulfitobacter sp.]|nr:hypothetical protein [Sulfitobacter sp.]
MSEALVDVVAKLPAIPGGDRFEPGPTIFATRPWGPDSDALVLSEEVVDGAAPSAPSFVYLCEVLIANEVLDVWSSWRDGRRPSHVEAVDAVIYYAVNDAYQPAE